MTGFGVAGASFGVPDIGLVSATEMIERVRVLATAAAPVPLIADGDNGHGGPLNAARLTRAYERAGAACIQLEDQVLPKRCGHMEDKEVVSRAEAAAKIRAAVDARSKPRFKIMARTDARATHGLDEALRRGEDFLKAGADILFIEAPRDEKELETVARTFPGMPLVANLVEDGKTPLARAGGTRSARLQDHPLSRSPPCSRSRGGWRRSMRRCCQAIVRGLDGARASFAHYNEIIDLPEFLA